MVNKNGMKRNSLILFLYFLKLQRSRYPKTLIAITSRIKCSPKWCPSASHKRPQVMRGERGCLFITLHVLELVNATKEFLKWLYYPFSNIYVHTYGLEKINGHEGDLS